MNLYTLLVKNKDRIMSGEELSDHLNVTRAAVWKNINALRKQGVIINSIQSQGYQLQSTQHVLDLQHLKLLLPDTEIHVYDSLTSTNDTAKTLTDKPALIIANEQTAGKGRRGKSFYSPARKGLYMSYIPKYSYALEDTAMITIRTALALHGAILSCFNIDTQIKWLNDIYLDDRKVAGILVEGSLELQTKTYEQLIIGVGLNLEDTTIPSDLDGIYGSLQLDTYSLYEFIEAFIHEFNTLDESTLIQNYRERSMIFGRKVLLDRDQKIYTAIDIDVQGGLILKDDKGNLSTITHGEVSLKLHDN